VREGALSEIKFESAGLHVRPPLPAPEHAIEVAKQFGVDRDCHRPQPISPKLVGFYDMIVAMETWQYTSLRSSFAQHHEKLFLLPLLDSKVVGAGLCRFQYTGPIWRPAKRPSAFTKCFDRISRCIDKLIVMTKQ